MQLWGCNGLVDSTLSSIKRVETVTIFLSRVQNQGVSLRRPVQDYNSQDSQRLRLLRLQGCTQRPGENKVSWSRWEPIRSHTMTHAESQISLTNHTAPYSRVQPMRHQDRSQVGGRRGPAPPPPVRGHGAASRSDRLIGWLIDWLIDYQ